MILWAWRRLFVSTALLSAILTQCEAHRRHTTKPTQVRIVAIHPHNTSAFTEGLFMLDGALIESTGLPQQSFIREYRLKNTVVVNNDKEGDHDDRSNNTSDHTSPFLNEYQYVPSLFGEGIACIGDNLYALTYKAKKILVLSRKTFQLQSIHPFVTTTGEGWGMTTDGQHLIVSDGSSTIQFYEPSLNDFQLVRTLDVKLSNGEAQTNLNELEYIDNELVANIWQENRLLRISLKDGHVIEDMDFTWLVRMVSNLGSDEMKSNPRQYDAVMNGIAYDSVTRHVFVTGKLWDSLFELEFSYLKHNHRQKGGR